MKSTPVFVLALLLIFISLSIYSPNYTFIFFVGFFSSIFLFVTIGQYLYHKAVKKIDADLEKKKEFFD